LTEERVEVRTLADDIANLFSGVMPTKLALLGAPKLRWWRVKRCKGFGWPDAAFYVLGVFSDQQPGLGDTWQATGVICWMAHDLTWCRCEEGWYRLGGPESATKGRY
jgi:hypothetical protein